MNKKKILVLAMTLSMVAILAIGGTIAYFTDNEVKTNTMTVGNISINLEELMKNDEGKWVPFKDNQFMLFPVENADGYNTGNKVVITMNDSPSKAAAYIRTFILFEKNTKLADTFVNEQDCCVPGLHYSYVEDSGSSYLGNGITDHGVKSSLPLTETVTVGDKEYWVALCEHHSEAAIPYGEGLFALKSVWMDKNIKAEEVDGWGIDGVQVIAFSQGIQAQDLSYAEAMKALGDITVTNVENWIANAKVAEINDYVAE